MSGKEKSTRMQHIAKEQRGCALDRRCTHVFEGVNCARSCRPGGKCFESNGNHPAHPSKQPLRKNRAKKLMPQ